MRIKFLFLLLFVTQVSAGILQTFAERFQHKKDIVNQKATLTLIVFLVKDVKNPEAHLNIFPKGTILSQQLGETLPGFFKEKFQTATQLCGYTFKDPEEIVAVLKAGDRIVFPYRLYDQKYIDLIERAEHKKVTFFIPERILMHGRKPYAHVRFGDIYISPYDARWEEKLSEAKQLLTQQKNCTLFVHAPSDKQISALKKWLENLEDVEINLGLD